MSSRKEEGLRARSGEFSHYDQVDKAKNYHLAEQSDESFDEDFEIKICDMAPARGGSEVDRLAFAAELGAAMEEIGFAILVGHGVPIELYESAEEQVLAFYDDTSLEERLAYRAQRQGSIRQGYFPIEETSDIHPDLVEGWVFCRRAFHLNEDQPFDESAFWPRPGFEGLFRELVQAQEKLVLPLTQAMLRHLGVDPHLFDERMQGTNFGLRLNHYPALSDEDLARGAARILGHEDVDLFTLLPAPSVEGLQVLKKDGRWVRLNAPPGSIIINTGDYLQRISNDRYPSTTHRVSPPQDQSLARCRRVSFPQAIYLWEDEILEVLPGLGTPKYEPIRAISFHTRTTAKFYGDDYAVD